MNIKRIIAIFILLIVVSSGSLYAQRGGGMRGGGQRGQGGQGGQGGMQMQQRLEPQDLVASTGLFMIDYDPVIKKCKIKEEEQQTKVYAHIATYTEEYSNIMFEYRPQIDSLSNFQLTMTEGVAVAEMQEQMKAQMLIIQKIKAKTTPMHKKLVDGLTTVLSEKEKKRWDSYYKEICEENFFMIRSREAPQDGSGERPSGTSSRTGGGMGGLMR